MSQWLVLRHGLRCAPRREPPSEPCGPGLPGIGPGLPGSIGGTPPCPSCATLPVALGRVDADRSAPIRPRIRPYPPAPAPDPLTKDATVLANMHPRIFCLDILDGPEPTSKYENAAACCALSVALAAAPAAAAPA